MSLKAEPVAKTAAIWVKQLICMVFMVVPCAIFTQTPNDITREST